MKFQDGEETGNDCPKCGKPCVWATGTMDSYDNRTEIHYTKDVPMVVCSDSDCDYQDDDYEPEFDEGDDEE